MPTLEETLTNIAGEVSQISADVAAVEEATTSKAGLVKISDVNAPEDISVPTIEYLKTKNILDENSDASGGSGGGGGSATSGVVKTINQTAHGFNVGNAIGFDGSAYFKVQADSAANAEFLGFVQAVDDVDNFTIQTAGFISGFSGLTPGLYYIDPATAGAITATKPSEVGQIEKPVLLATSATTGFILQLRGVEIGGGVDGGIYLTVKQATYATQLQTGSTNYIDSGLQGVMAAKDASNAIEITVFLAAFSDGNDGAIGEFRILRDSVDITGDQLLTQDHDQTAGKVTTGYSFIDEPGDTNAHTYKVQVKVNFGTLTVFENNRKATMILKEIKGGLSS